MTSRRRKKQIVIIRDRRQARLVAEQQQELERLVEEARMREQKKLENEAIKAEKELLDKLGVEKKVEIVKTENGIEEEKIEVVSKKDKKTIKNALKEIPKTEEKVNDKT